MPNSQIKVLYIAGYERSGSTIVHRVLGQIDGFVAWGELRDIWQHGIIENRTCTCGVPFRECQAWRRIMGEAFGGIDLIDSSKMVRLMKKTKSSVLPHHFGILRDSSFKESIGEYLTNLEKLYRAIQSHTGSRVIVDSTKASWYGYILGMLPTIDLYVAHIVRDPRGVGNSLQRYKMKGDPACQWYNPVHCSLTWNLKNSGVELLLNRSDRRYLRMRYEDFVQNPQIAIEKLLSLVEEKTTQLPFGDRSGVKMNVDHIFAGSPSSRDETGLVQLKLDERWKKEMKPLDRAVFTALTWHRLKKYGYQTQ